MDCIIVRRGNHQVYGGLHQIFGQFLPVIWDRRRVLGGDDMSAPAENERRQAASPNWTAKGYFVARVTTDRTPASSRIRKTSSWNSGATWRRVPGLESNVSTGE